MPSPEELDFIRRQAEKNKLRGRRLERNSKGVNVAKKIIPQKQVEEVPNNPDIAEQTFGTTFQNIRLNDQTTQTLTGTTTFGAMLTEQFGDRPTRQRTRPGAPMTRRAAALQYLARSNPTGSAGFEDQRFYYLSHEAHLEVEDRALLTHGRIYRLNTRTAEYESEFGFILWEEPRRGTVLPTLTAVLVSLGYDADGGEQLDTLRALRMEEVPEWVRLVDGREVHTQIDRQIYTDAGIIMFPA